jgi:hypothetical protein
MDSRNLLIFTVYLIIVSYVLYQAYKALGNQVVIDTDYGSLNQQLEEQEIKELIDIKFKFKDRYKLDELTKLMISIKNTSQEDTIRVDWDESSITDFDKVTGRVIRLATGMTNIPQSQAVSIIVPGRIIQEELSDDKSILSPLFKPAKIKEASIKNNPFYLRLFLTISNPTGAKRSYTLRCKFIPKPLDLAKALSIELKPKK